ncbi:hypothetical protein GGU10DRAFT_279848, partial [Lentinula aff. detonsa]
LLLDMKVHWSSTFVMLHCAWTLKDVCHFFYYLLLPNDVDKFINDLVFAEKSATKKEKLALLEMMTENWENLELFAKLLQLADNARQEFSADTYPTLYLALPALEKLHYAWSKWHNSQQYQWLKPALTAALSVIKEYYQRTSKSMSYLVVMVLDPTQKMEYFKCNWLVDLQTEVKNSLWALVCDSLELF